MSGIQQAIAIAGSQAKLAEIITAKRIEKASGNKVSVVTQAHVSYWLNVNLPARIALEIEAALDGQVTRRQLLPGLFDDT